MGKKVLVILVLFVMPIVRLALHSPDLQYALWIDEQGFALETTLSPAGRGLYGSEITSLLFREDDPKDMVAWGPVSSYISTDGGSHWRPLTIEDRMIDMNVRFRWKKGEPLRFDNMGEVWSTRDFGKTWKVWDEPSVVGTRHAADGSMVAILYEPDGSDTYRRVDLSADEPKLAETVDKPELQSFTGDEAQITAGGTLLDVHTFTSPEGKNWAVASSGLYSENPSDHQWRSNAVELSSPQILMLRQSPKEPSRVAALSAGGQAWESRDFGFTWSPLKGTFNSVRFTPRGRLILASGGLKVLEEGREVGPPETGIPDLFLRTPAIEKYNFDDVQSMTEYLGDRLEFQDAGRDVDGKLWVLTTHLGASRHPYGGPLSEPRYDWQPLDVHGLLVQLPGGWETRDGTALGELNTGSSPPNLSSDENGNHVFYKGVEIGTLFSFVGLPEKLDWLQAGVRYYLIGENGIQLGYVSSEKPVPPAVAYSWGYSVSDDSLRYGTLDPTYGVVRKKGDRLEFLIPSSIGVWRGEVPLADSWNWRRLAHFLAFGWGFWVIWGALGLSLLWVKRREN